MVTHIRKYKILGKRHRHSVLYTHKEQGVKAPGRKLGQDNEEGMDAVSLCVLRQTFRLDDVDALAKSLADLM